MLKAIRHPRALTQTIFNNNAVEKRCSPNIRLVAVVPEVPPDFRRHVGGHTLIPGGVVSLLRFLGKQLGNSKVRQLPGGSISIF